MSLQLFYVYLQACNDNDNSDMDKLYRNYAKDICDVGFDINTIDTDNNQSIVNYTIMIDENKGVPNVPEALVFDNKEDAKEWVTSLGMMLYNF